MARETAAARAARAQEILAALARTYPQAHCELDYSTPLELLIATILSAQCTDKRVNIVTKELFRVCKSAADFVALPQEQLEEIVHTTGFFRAKAKNIKACCTALVERHGGEVPRTMDELLELRGVARKTANVVLGNCFGIQAGVVVDTHVGRLAKRLGLSKHDDPGKVERDLMALFPRDAWCELSHLLIFHGRAVCRARGNACATDAICGEHCSEARPRRARAKPVTPRRRAR